MLLFDDAKMDSSEPAAGHGQGQGESQALVQKSGGEAAPAPGPGQAGQGQGQGGIIRTAPHMASPYLARWVGSCCAPPNPNLI